MISLFHKNQKIIVIISAVIILLFIFSSIGYMGVSGVTSNNSVAVVGKEKISANMYETLTAGQLRQIRAMGVEDNEQMRAMVQSQVLGALIRESALYQSARAAGFGTSDYQIAFLVHRMFNVGGIFSKNQYVDYLLENYRMKPAAFEKYLKHSLTAAIFERSVIQPFKLTPQEIEYVYQGQHGSMKDFAKNKEQFIPTVSESKNQAAMQMFFDHFSKTTEIRTMLPQ